VYVKDTSLLESYPPTVTKIFSATSPVVDSGNSTTRDVLLIETILA